MDHFLTYKKGNLGPVFNFTAYIYIHTYMYSLWSYYLVQVWPLEGLLSGLSV